MRLRRMQLPVPRHDGCMTRYADASLHPLTSDAEVEQRVAELIGGACRRQLWFMFLDERGVQLPLLVPVADHPRRPPKGRGAHLDAMVRHLVDTVDAASVIVVIERPGAPSLSRDDREWALALHEACGTAEVPLRALLLSHRAGVRWVAQDDYRF